MIWFQLILFYFIWSLTFHRIGREKLCLPLCSLKPACPEDRLFRLICGMSSSCPYKCVYVPPRPFFLSTWGACRTPALLFAEPAGSRSLPAWAMLRRRMVGMKELLQPRSARGGVAGCCGRPASAPLPWRPCQRGGVIRHLLLDATHAWGCDQLRARLWTSASQQIRLGRDGERRRGVISLHQKNRGQI
jgi:hypothetical protein